MPDGGAGLAKAHARIVEWRNNSAKFVYDNFHVEPDRWQLQALEAFDDPAKSRISLQACAGPGKTAVLAWCGWKFLSCYASVGEHPKGVAISITSTNLDDNLWAELSKWRERSEFLKHAFTWTKSKIFANDHPSTWFLSARSWAKTASPEEQGRTLSGLHSKYVLYLVDESGDISTAVLKAAEQGLSNCAFGKILQAGNTTSHAGMLYFAATNREQWFVIQITADPDDPDRSPRIDINWAREQIQLYGRDNPWVMAYILGKFPPSSINTLLGPDDVADAMKRTYRDSDINFAARILGVDAARFGDDPWVIFPRQGLVAFNPVEMRGPKTQEAAARISQAWQRWDADACFPDDTGGYAAGAIDALQLAGFSPIPINFSGKATDSRYFNKRSEMIFKCAEWVKGGGALPNVPQLTAELTTPTYWLHEGKLRVEEKEQIKVRLGRSTNYSDALALTFAQPVAPRGLRLPGQEQKRHALTEYDPIADTATAYQHAAKHEFDPYARVI
jgi:phage terminase large subunit